MSLINCEINLVQTWSTNCVISDVLNQATTFAITDTKRYVSIVSFPTQDNAKLLQKLTGININRRYRQKHKTNI